MFNLKTLMPKEIVEALGWTLFHSIWQATVVAGVLFLALWLTRKHSARLRYMIAYMALMAVLTWAGLTFTNAYQYAIEKQKTTRHLLSNPEELAVQIAESLQPDNMAPEHAPSAITMNRLKFRIFMQRHFNTMVNIWLAGVLLFLFRTAGSLWHIQKFRTRHAVPAVEIWQEKVEKLKNKLNLNRTIVALESAIAKMPMTLGYLKPVIILPISMFTGMTHQEIEAVIAHELAHIKRHDYLLNIVQSAIETIFFFHPAVWFISKSIRTEREHSCDELAIEATNDKLNYLKALAVSEKLAQNHYGQHAMAFSGTKGGLLSRVKRITTPNTMKKNVTEGFFAASIVFVSIILLSFTFDANNFKKELNSLQESQPEKAKNTKPTVVQTPPGHDSIATKVMVKVDALDTPPEELEQLVEVAYTSDNDTLSHFIVKSIDEAFDAVYINAVIEEALSEVDSAMKEVNFEVTINQALAEAKAELEEAEEVPEVAKASFELVQTTLEDIDVDGIVELSLESTKKALEAVDVSAIVEEALQNVKIEFHNTSVECPELPLIQDDGHIHFEKNESEKPEKEEKIETLEEKLRELEE